MHLTFRKYLFGFLTAVMPLSASCQEVLWANKVLGYSSEYRPSQIGHAYRSKQILGVPSKLPDFGNSPCAWSPADPDGRNEEWIKVGFAKSIALKQIAIAENFNPGAIARVYAYDAAGKEYLVLENPAAQQAVKGRMLRIFPTQNIQANAVKVVLQPNKVPGFNQIDAIGISSETAPIEAKINFTATQLKTQKENMGKAINSKGQEVAPIISPDGKTLYFTRNNFEGNIGSPSRQDVWYSTLNDKGQWTDALNMGSPINNAGDNAITSISADGKTIYLINEYRPDGSMYFGFSRSFKTKSGWGFPKSSKITNLVGSATTIEITVSPFENVLIMSVQRADSEGGKDLYISFLQKDNTWSEPRNLGSVINTADYEGTPFLALDNKTLYFSSQGHAGYGEGDLFLTRRLDDTWLNWSTPENLGPAINSPLWDAFINIPATGDYAYFSASDKVLGQEDIFRIRMTPEIKPDPVAVVSGNVFEAETTKPVKSEITADFKNSNNTFAKANFDPETGEYRLILPLKEVYRISASGEGYFPVSEDMDLLGDNAFRTIRKNIYLHPIKAGQQIRLSNTMFSQSSAEVTPASLVELDRIAETMQTYPTMEILLEGHTDNQGEVQKNVKLSADRVEQVKKYLLSKGIDGRRIQTKAWGPARPIASNLTEQTRQKNRRVEFTILKI
ncbi:OmpA family protein [Dyadobacter fermentans]|uniref:OmpA/MotB domain protein n=1 Tax=Dyadobacter fermentans (strain ATCC 700827 / DSM 18053 / CIP 107007 / KCTC 52180 / NS114) TaxID=471854 RepID=C6VS72_DYAFD|nr:OmpA family protein [Dyadobacter fermentans]ACT96307.1 OmpA/MotB domain protein [Dyadobacter fermentans DSM 18053]